MIRRTSFSVQWFTDPMKSTFNMPIVQGRIQGKEESNNCYKESERHRHRDQFVGEHCPVTPTGIPQ